MWQQLYEITRRIKLLKKKVRLIFKIFMIMNALDGF